MEKVNIALIGGGFMAKAHRYTPAVPLAKKLIDEGKIGNVRNF